MPDAGVAGDAARRVAGSAQPQLLGRVGIQQIAFQHAAIDHHGPARGHAFVVEGRCAEQAGNSGVVDDGDVLRCDASRRACPPGTRRDDRLPIAFDGFENIADQGSRGDRLENHRHFLRGDFARIQAAHGSLGGAAANVGRAFEIRMAARDRIPVSRAP